MNSEENVLSVRIGTDKKWGVQATSFDPSTGVYTPVAFSPSDTPECTVWQGADSPALFQPTATWVNAPQGELQLSVGNAQTTQGMEGIYPLEITVTTAAGGLKVDVLDGWLQLVGSPGTAMLPPVYCTYQDMVDFGGGSWLEALRRKNGFVQFTRERARARSYLDTIVVKKFRPWAGRTIHWSETTIVGPPDARNPVILGYLAANALMVTDDVIEICALKALELVCRQNVTLEDSDKMATRANYFCAQCRRRVLTTAAELDINNDGLADYAFSLNVINIR
jgi:hypothetical protein